MKRRLLVKSAATAGGAALLLSACGGSADPEVGVPTDGENVSGTVTMWTYPLATIDSTEWWQPHVESFQEEFPNVEVEVVMQAFTNREEALVTAIGGGNAPDVVYFNPDFIPQYANEDLLLPLDDMRDDWDSFVPTSLEAMTWEDTLYAAPLLMQRGANFCHADVMAEAGIEKCPTTWDELREAGPKVAETGQYLTEYQGTGTLNHSFYQYLWQAGGEVLNEDQTAAGFNSPEGLEALEFIEEMVDNGWVPQQPLSVQEQFEQSDVAQGNVLYESGGNLPQLREYIDPEKIVTTEPMSHEEQVSIGSVGAWSIFNTTDAPEAAQAWVSYLSDPEFIEAFAQESGYLDPREDVTGVFDDDPQIAEGEQYLDTVRVGVSHPQAREMLDIIRPHIQSVLLEGSEPQAALDAAEADVNAMLERG